MEQPQFGFDQLIQPESVRTMTEIFWDTVYEGDVLKKGVAQKFLSDLYYHLDSATVPPITKYHSMLVLKEILNKNDLKVIGVLATSTQFLQGLQKIILNVDPKKPMNEKGKNYFPNDKNGIGNKYVQLVVQTLMYLSKKYSKTSKGDPTKFRKAMLKIQSQNVNLPSELKHYNLGKSSKQASASNIKDKNEKKSDVQQQRQKSPPKNRTNQQKPPQRAKQRQPSSVQNPNFEGIISFVKFKIKDYMANLQQSDDVEQMQQSIVKTHEIFKGQLGKFDEMGETIFQSYSQKPNVIEQYLNVRGFLEAEKEIYEKQISKNQFAAYYNAIKIKYEEMFPQEKQTPGQSKGQQRLSKEQSKRQIKKTDSITAVNANGNKRAQQNKSKYNSKNSREDDRERVPALVSRNSEHAEPVQMRTKQSAINPGRQASEIFSRMQNAARSKSPKAGFRQLRQSLQKEKKNIHAHPPSRLREGKNLAASTLSRDPMTSSIFNNVPNPAPPHKSYQGELVIASKQLENILFDIKKEQSHRRFKVANFRDKYPLFENQNIQIGFKSEGIFEQYDGFNTFLSMELYFGNKSSRQIRDLELSFEADENCLIYTSPRQISPVIDPESQIKHGLMIIPTKLPFGFINMKLYYQCGSTATRTTIALPNSLLKLSTHSEFERSQFLNYWDSVTKIYKTDHFKLSKHIPPNSIRKYMPSLRQLSSYSQFSMPGSVKDYELYCLVDVHQDYEGALRINFRPDLNVVIQIGAIEPSQDGAKYLKHYLQTLQMLLQETNG